MHEGRSLYDGPQAISPEDEAAAAAIIKMLGPRKQASGGYEYEDENGMLINPGRGAPMNGPNGPMMPFLPQFHSEMGMLPGGAGQWMMQNPLNFIP